MPEKNACPALVIQRQVVGLFLMHQHAHHE